MRSFHSYPSVAWFWEAMRQGEYFISPLELDLWPPKLKKKIIFERKSIFGNDFSEF